MQYIVYTDGACSGNPGPGACASFVTTVKHPELQHLITKSFRLTTNNRMELMAILMVFNNIPVGESVKFITDSRYVADAVNKGWLNRWEDSGFHKRPNADLWKILIIGLKRWHCTFEWIKGHNENKGNEYVNKHAQKAIGREPILVDTYYEKENQTFSKGTREV